MVDLEADVEAERVAGLVELEVRRVAGGGQAHAAWVAFLRADRRGGSGTGALGVAPQDQLGHGGADHRPCPQHDRVVEDLAREEGDMRARCYTVAIDVEAIAPGVLRDDVEGSAEEGCMVVVGYVGYVRVDVNEGQPG